MGRIREGRLDGILLAEFPVEATIVWDIVVDQGAAVERCVHADNGGQHAVVHLDQFGRVTRRIAGFRDDDGHLIADMTNLADRERRVRRLRHGRAVLVVNLPAAGEAADTVRGHVRAGQNGDYPIGFFGLGRVDPVDGGVGMRRAQNPGMALPGTVDVVGVVAVAGQEPLILDPLDGRADARAGHRATPSGLGRRRGWT